MLKALTVSPSTKHTSTVIFVHGLGDSGAGWKSLATHFSQDPDLNHIKWVLPHAPIMPVTGNNGHEMPSWFNILSFGDVIPTNEDEAGMLKNVQALDQLVAEEISSGIDISRIVFGGFSQGAAMTLLSGLTTTRKFAGLAVLSGRLPLHHKIEAMLSSHAKNVPIFWAHGTADSMIPIAAADASVNLLLGLGIPKTSTHTTELTPGIDFHPYKGMVHSTSPAEIEDLKVFLKKALPK